VRRSVDCCRFFCHLFISTFSLNLSLPFARLATLF
jgi:hypothetical protein